MLDDTVMATEFAYSDTETWWCPDKEKFKLNNDPALYKYGPGVNLVMVVNECSVAQKIAEEKDLTPFDCPLESDVAELYVEQMRVWVKSMTKDVDDRPYYMENRKMKTYFSNRQRTGLSKGF